MAVLGVEFSPQATLSTVRAALTGTNSERASRVQFWLARLQVLLEHGVAITTQAFSQQLANVLIALMTPAAVVALAMGLWRVSADLGWAGAFLITGGFFSHWQVWIALSVALKMLSSTLIAWGSRTGKFSEEN